MTKDEALTMALTGITKVPTLTHGLLVKLADVEAAIKEALAQPEQEPLEYWNAVEGWVKVDEVRKHFDSAGCGTIYKTAGEDRVPLYASPPQRQPLPAHEIVTMYDESPTSDGDMIAFARAIEAAHGIGDKT